MKQTGDEYYDSKEFRDILQEYELLHRKGETILFDADDLTDIADYYRLTGKDEEAREAISLAISLAPGSAGPLTFLIHEALDRNDTAKAEQLLSQMDDPGAADYQYCFGEILLAKGKEEEAEEYFRKNFSNVPADEYQDYVLDVANIFSDYGYSEKAMKWMQHAKPEDNSNFKELMARTLFGLGKYTDSARIFNELIDRDPYSKRYWTALASAQYMEEKYDESVASSEYAIAIDPDDAEGLLYKASGLYHLENYEEAAKYFERYAEQVPDDDLALMQLGISLINTGRTEEGIDRLEQAWVVASRNHTNYETEILVELAFNYGETGEFDKAMERLKLAESLNYDPSVVKVINGHLLLKQNDTEGAEQLFHAAFLESNYSPEILLRIIVSFYDNSYVAHAHFLFTHYLEKLEKEGGTARCYLALCCLELKKYEEFMEHLKILSDKYPDEARHVLGHLFPEGLKPEEYYDYMLKRSEESGDDSPLPLSD